MAKLKVRHCQEYHNARSGNPSWYTSKWGECSPDFERRLLIVGDLLGTDDDPIRWLHTFFVQHEEDGVWRSYPYRFAEADDGAIVLPMDPEFEALPEYESLSYRLEEDAVAHWLESGKARYLQPQKG